MIKREISRYSMLSHSVMSDFLKYHGLQPTRLLCPWGFSRQEYWSGLPCPPPEDLPNPGIEPRSPALQADSLLTEPAGKHTHYNNLPLMEDVDFTPVTLLPANTCTILIFPSSQNKHIILVGSIISL